MKLFPSNMRWRMILPASSPVWKAPAEAWLRLAPRPHPAPAALTMVFPVLGELETMDFKVEMDQDQRLMGRMGPLFKILKALPVLMVLPVPQAKVLLPIV